MKPQATLDKAPQQYRGVIYCSGDHAETSALISNFSGEPCPEDAYAISTELTAYSHDEAVKGVLPTLLTFSTDHPTTWIRVETFAVSEAETAWTHVVLMAQGTIVDCHQGKKSRSENFQERVFLATEERLRRTAA